MIDLYILPSVHLIYRFDAQKYLVGSERGYKILIFFNYYFSLDLDVIKEKIRKLKERARVDSNFAAFLRRESDEVKTEGVGQFTTKNIVTSSEGPDKVVVTSTSNSLSNKQLEREVYIEALRCEQEKFRIMVENGQLEKDKLKREANWMEIQLQLAQTELALKKQECQEKGIIIQNQ